MTTQSQMTKARLSKANRYDVDVMRIAGRYVPADMFTPITFEGRADMIIDRPESRSEVFARVVFGIKLTTLQPGHYLVDVKTWNGLNGVPTIDRAWRMR